MFQGIWIDKQDGHYSAELRGITKEQLPDGDVTVRVSHSGLNYKDALAITGKSPVVRQFPMVPGIDFAGVVESSSHPDYKPGDSVVLNGWGVGEKHWGGLAEFARVQGDWLVPLQAPFTLRQAMGIGTAGYTAMLCVMALERHGITPASGPVVVTGAAGGVGSVAVAVLARLGYEVSAVTGRPEQADYLRHLGARHIVERTSLSAPGKPLAREQWAGAIDVAGGYVLANVCAAMRYRGVVAACGLASGMDFPATVAPFILRGVTLVGVDSVMAPREERLQAWKRLASDLDVELLESLMQEVSLADALKLAPQMLEGKVRGRVVVAVRG